VRGGSRRLVFGPFAMTVSYEKQFLFIHVGKTAGTSLARALEPHAHRPERDTPARYLDRLGVHVNYLGPHRWRRFRLHATAAKVRRHLPRDVWDGLFKFAFVRNPYERLVSQYRHVLRQPAHHRHETVRRLGSFGAFVAWESRRRKGTQASFLLDRRGRYLLDFVGRFETISEDFEHVRERVGLEASLPGGNERNAADFADAYADDATRRLADGLVGEDARLLGYGFDGPLWGTSELNRRLEGLREIKPANCNPPA